MTVEPNLAEAPPIVAAKPSSKQFHRYLHAAAFVGLWMAIGWIFRLDANSYLLIGVPLTVVFQIFVRRKPLVTLWVRAATNFRLSKPQLIVGMVLALGFAVLPAMTLVESFQSGSWRREVPETLWSFCAVVGAFGAGFSFAQFTKQTWKSLLLCLATAGVIGCGIMASVFLVKVLMHKAALSLSFSQVKAGVASLLIYVPICFVLEEVSFRGAIDAYVHQSGDRYPWLSALFVSCLWGWWHLPTLGARNVLELIVMVVALPLMHAATGIFLSFGWRRSGNLAVPAVVHALIDGVRNMLLK
jgi:hypothetical protein